MALVDSGTSLVNDLLHVDVAAENVTKGPSGNPAQLRFTPHTPPDPYPACTGRRDGQGTLAIANLQSAFSLTLQFDLSQPQHIAHLVNVEQIGHDQPKGLSWQAA